MADKDKQLDEQLEFIARQVWADDDDAEGHGVESAPHTAQQQKKKNDGEPTASDDEDEVVLTRHDASHDTSASTISSKQDEFGGGSDIDRGAPFFAPGLFSSSAERHGQHQHQFANKIQQPQQQQAPARSVRVGISNGRRVVMSSGGAVAVGAAAPTYTHDLSGIRRQPLDPEPSARRMAPSRTLSQHHHHPQPSAGCGSATPPEQYLPMTVTVGGQPGGGGGGATTGTSGHDASFSSTTSSLSSAPTPLQWDGHTPAVYVQNLEPRTSQKELFNTFFPMGATSVEMQQSGGPGGIRKTGIVFFPSTSLAQIAELKINNFVPHGQTLPLTVTHLTKSNCSILTAGEAPNAFRPPASVRPAGGPPMATPDTPPRTVPYGGAVSIRVGNQLIQPQTPPLNPAKTECNSVTDLALPSAASMHTPPPTLPPKIPQSQSQSIESQEEFASATGTGSGALQQHQGASALQRYLDEHHDASPIDILEFVVTYPDTEPMIQRLLYLLGKEQHRGLALLNGLLALLAEPKNSKLKARFQEGISRPIIRRLLSATEKSERIGSALVCASLFEYGFIAGTPFAMAKKLLQSRGSETDNDLVDALVSMTSAWACRGTATEESMAADAKEEEEFRAMVTAYYQRPHSGQQGQPSPSSLNPMAGSFFPREGPSSRPTPPGTTVASYTRPTPTGPGDFHNTTATSIASRDSHPTNRSFSDHGAGSSANAFGFSTPEQTPIRIGHLTDSPAMSSVQSTPDHHPSTRGTTVSGSGTSSGMDTLLATPSKRLVFADEAEAEDNAVACTVYVTRLPAGTPEARLRAIFMEYGTLNKVRLYEDQQGRGAFGFVEFCTPEAAQRMIAHCDRRRVESSIVRCNTARSSIHDQDLRDAIYDADSRERVRDCLFGICPRPKANIRRTA